MIIIHSKKPHINVLSGGKTDASLKYFNMMNYFTKKESILYLAVSKETIYNSIKMKLLSSHILK